MAKRKPVYVSAVEREGTYQFIHLYRDGSHSAKIVASRSREGIEKFIKDNLGSIPIDITPLVNQRVVKLTNLYFPPEYQ